MTAELRWLCAGGGGLWGQGGLGEVGTPGEKVMGGQGWCRVGGLYVWGLCVGSVMCIVTLSNPHFHLCLSL